MLTTFYTGYDLRKYTGYCSVWYPHTIVHSTRLCDRMLQSEHYSHRFRYGSSCLNFDLTSQAIVQVTVVQITIYRNLYENTGACNIQ